MKKSAGYIRVSTLAQAKEGESLSTQRRAIEDYCPVNGMDLTEVYADEGVSGSSVDGRAELIRMLRDASENKFNCLIIHRLSRFGRNARELLNNVEELKHHDIKLISLKENIDFSTPYGQAMLAMLAAMAQLERDVIKEQMNENKMARWRRCETFIGKPPYGYSWKKEKKRLEVNQVEADVYKNIISMYLDKGFSFKDMAIKLRDEGIKCKRTFFTSTTISYMLKNPAYYGNYVVNQRKYENSKRTKELKPSNEHIVFKIPPIIDKITWDKVQAKTHFNTVKSKRTIAAKDYWLRDILMCGECGGVIKPRHGSYRKDGTFPRYYTCYWGQAKNKDFKIHNKNRCTMPLLIADKIEDWVFENIMFRLSFDAVMDNDNNLIDLLNPEKYDKLISEQEIKLNNYHQIIHKKEKARERIIDILEEDDFDKSAFYERYMKYNEEIETIQACVIDIQKKMAYYKEVANNNTRFINFIKDNQDWLTNIQNELFNLSREDKKRFIESIIDGKIYIYIDQDEAEGVPLHPSIALPNFSLNSGIFELLSQEGKISSLDKNGA